MPANVWPGVPEEERILWNADLFPLRHDGRCLARGALADGPGERLLAR